MRDVSRYPLKGERALRLTAASQYSPPQVTSCETGISFREQAHGSYNLEKVLKLSSRLEKSLNSVTL